MIKIIKNKFVVWFPTVVWMIVIFGFSSVPSIKASQVDWQDLIIRKTAHFSEYAILAILFFRSLRISGSDKFNAAFSALLLTILYAFTDEFHQSFIVGREPALRDVFIDSLGASFGVIFIKMIAKVPLISSFAGKLDIS